MVQSWLKVTGLMKKSLRVGIFEPFLEALQEGLEVHGSTLDKFEAEATALLQNRRTFRWDGSAVGDPSKGDVRFAPFLKKMQLVAEYMVTKGELSLHDVANYECYLFFTSCLLGTYVLTPQTFKKNLINDVFMDDNLYIHESFATPLSGGLLITDVKSRESTLAWLMMVCVVRPMRFILDNTKPNQLQFIWGMGGDKNTLVSSSTWEKRIAELGRFHLGTPRSGTCLSCVVVCIEV
jgi:hypothetical protein